MQSLDAVPLPLLLLGIIALLSVIIEIGYQLGKRIGGEQGLSKHPVEASVTTAVLSLMAFMLGFSFATAASRYSSRRALILEEANATGTAYLRADLLPATQMEAARTLIRDYVQLRSDATSKRNLEELAPALQKSTELQNQLWLVAIKSREESASASVNLFITAINDLIDIDAKRRMVGLVNRFPQALWLTLGFLGVLATTMLGISSGLHGRRSRLATSALIVAFSVVFVQIVDIDRPFRALFKADGSALSETLRSMEP
ncbi:MAG: hypothetical protein ACR2RV_19770 [Verrucomicrobiales bacterium]